MYTGLVAEHPRQPVDVHFDYLHIYEVARLIFSSHVLDIESDDSSDEPRSARSSASSRPSGRIQEYWYDREVGGSCGGYTTSWTQDHRCPSPPISYRLHGSRYQHSDIHFIMPLPLQKLGLESSTSRSLLKKRKTVKLRTLSSA